LRYLIDGYNVMFAGLTVPKGSGPGVLRSQRGRFLDRLAGGLGPADASQSTIVFDARDARTRPGAPVQSTYKGMTVLYAVDDGTADDRIERLIAEDTAPRALTVVSTDHRLRQAAARRGARVMTSDDFWVMLDARRERESRRQRLGAPPAAGPAAQGPGRVAPSAEETAYWLGQFADLADDPRTRDALNPGAPLLTDEEIAAIEREIQAEGEGETDGPQPKPVR
jgi:predicted RNA-binding protein with PIN domain